VWKTTAGSGVLFNENEDFEIVDRKQARLVFAIGRSEFVVGRIRFIVFSII